MFQARKYTLLLLSIVVILLAGCGEADTTQSALPGGERVNIFGTNANHAHSIVALPDNVIVMATHYGVFRSTDAGKSWETVAAGPGQLMEGLMADSLVVSPLNSQRMFLLTKPALSGAKGTLGIYTSADQGRSWKLSIASRELGDPYLVRAGNDTADEVYTYIPKLGALGLKVSRDAGQHFTQTGTLPFGRILNLLALPGVPGQLLVCGDEGMARSADDGAHWEIVQGITQNGATDGITSIATAGPNSPIYAAGDRGIYVSQDGGKSFTVTSSSLYGGLVVSPAQTQVLYGITGRALYRSADGGHSWNALPAVNAPGRPEFYAPDPKDAAQVYVALSYPTSVYRFDQNSGQWMSLTPKS